MAYKDASGAFKLERSEEEQALTECVYGEGMPHLKTWDQLDKAHQKLTTIAFLRKHPEKRPDPKDPVGPKSGLTQTQLNFVGERVWTALNDVLPDLVEDVVNKMFEIDDSETRETLRKEFGAAINQLKNVDLKIIEAKIASAMRTGGTNHQAPGAQELQQLASRMDSLSHRQDRQQNHVGSIDTDVKDLKRQIMKLEQRG